MASVERDNRPVRAPYGTGAGMVRGAVLFFAIILRVSGHSLPLVFYPALDHTNSYSHFVARGLDSSAEFRSDSVTFHIAQDIVTLIFPGQRTGLMIRPEQSSGRHTFLNTSSTNLWRSAQDYRILTYDAIYPGVTLRYIGSYSGLKSEYHLEAFHDAREIRLQYSGATSINLDGVGNLLIHSLHGVVTEGKPNAYQVIRSQTRDVECAYVLNTDGTLGFSVGAHDPKAKLIIDPQIRFSTYFGGGRNDVITGLSLDSQGFLYLCGWTESIDLLTATPLQGVNAGSVDAFVAKLSQDGRTLIYATYIGGSGQDLATAIKVDNNNSAYVTGWTTSSNFPVRNALQPVLHGARNAFVFKLNASGSDFVYSTYLGGSGSDSSNGLDLDASGAAYIAGETTSRDFPVSVPAQRALRGFQNAFVAKLRADGSGLTYSTYLGGTGSEQAFGIAVRNGEAYITGWTSSVDFPVVSPFQAYNNGGQDGFITKLNSAGSALSYSSYIGGTNGGANAPEMGTAITVNGSGEAYIAGVTSSTDFPVLNAFQPAFGGGRTDAFICKVSAAGNLVIFSSYLGGSGGDYASSLALNPRGVLLIGGYTDSIDFPIARPLQDANNGLHDGFVVSLNAAATQMIFGSFWGGLGSDAITSLAIIGSGDVVFAGQTSSSNLPLQTPLGANNRGSVDGFIGRFSNVANPPHKAAIFRNGQWWLDVNGDGIWDSQHDAVFVFGQAGDIPIVGDWDNTGSQRIGIFRNGQWWLDMNGDHQWDAARDVVFVFGQAGDMPVIGDWDGSGQQRIGVFRNGIWWLDINGDHQWDQVRDSVFSFGQTGDIPVVGDWTGSGFQNIGIFRNGQWWLDLNGDRIWDSVRDALRIMGQAGDIPVIGDWTGTGLSHGGLFRSGQWLLDLNGDFLLDATNDKFFILGQAGDKPVASNWF